MWGGAPLWLLKCYKFFLPVGKLKKPITFARANLGKTDAIREHSSAGSEHLPYKQGVMGSNPFAPTDTKRHLKA